MPEIKKIEYTIQQLVELIIKDQKIHEGNWILAARYLQGAVNMGQQADGSDVAPTSISILNSIGIEPVPAPTPFSVDASAINPKRKKNIAHNE